MNRDMPYYGHLNVITYETVRKLSKIALEKSIILIKEKTISMPRTNQSTNQNYLQGSLHIDYKKNPPDNFDSSTGLS